MRQRYRAALNEAGITDHKYWVENPDLFELSDEEYTDIIARGIATTSIWGVEFKKGEQSLGVVEQTPHAEDKKYHLRAHRSVSGMERAPSLGKFNLQREAFAALIRRAYGL